MMNSSEINSDIRKQMLSRRQGMDEKRCIGLSARISASVSRMISDITSTGDREILTYYAINNEADPASVNDELIYAGEHVFFPVTKGNEMTFYRVMPGGDFIPGNFHCLEPADRSLPLDKTKSMIALVPGVAFSEKGYRLGYGKGYYDRFLPTCGDIIKIGLCYEFQLSGDISPSASDIPMDLIITEERVIMP